MHRPVCRAAAAAVSNAYLRNGRYCSIHGVDLMPAGMRPGTHRYCPTCPPGSILGRPLVLFNANSEGWAKTAAAVFRNPPATAAELRVASQGDSRPSLTWRSTKAFWIGVAVGACLPFAIGLLYLLVIR